MLYPAGVVGVGPRIFRTDPRRRRQSGGFGREHTEIGNSGRNQNEDRRHQGELGGYAAIAVSVPQGNFCFSPTAKCFVAFGHLHSATAIVRIAGRLPRPALAHPPAWSRDVASMSRVPTTSSKHCGPAALGAP